MKTLIVLLILFTSCATHHVGQYAPVVIGSAGISDRNSIGGVDVSVTFKNTSGKTINYLTFVVEAYNRVGDPVECEVTGSSTSLLRATGPYRHGRGMSILNPSRWQRVFYNHSITNVKIKEIIIEYENRQQETIKQRDIAYR